MTRLPNTQAGLTYIEKKEPDQSEKDASKDEEKKKQDDATKGLGRQPIPPNETVKLLHKLNDARESGDDQRRTLKRVIADYFVDRKPRKEPKAAEAAIEKMHDSELPNAIGGKRLVVRYEEPKSDYTRI